jgi:hypothetical protein
MFKKLILKIHYENQELETVSVDHFPYYVGRSIQNSHMIDRPQLSHRHFTIDQRDDGIYLFKVSKTNEIFFQNESISQLKIEDNISISTAGIKIDILCKDDLSDKTQEIYLDDFFFSEGEKKKYIYRFIQSFLYFIIPEILKIFFTDPITKANIENILIEICAMTFTSIAVAIFASIFSKIHCKKYQFFSFAHYANQWMGMISLFTFVPTYFYFYFNLFVLKTLISTIISTALLTFISYHYLRLILKRTSKKKIISILSTIIIFASMVKISLVTYNDAWGTFDFNGAIAYPIQNYSPEKYPPETLWKKFDKSIATVHHYRSSNLLEEKKLKEEDQVKY